MNATYCYGMKKSSKAAAPSAVQTFVWCLSFSFSVWTHTASKHFFCPGIKSEVGVNILRFNAQQRNQKKNSSYHQKFSWYCLRLALSWIAGSQSGYWEVAKPWMKVQRWFQDWVNRKMPAFSTYLLFRVTCHYFKCPLDGYYFVKSWWQLLFSLAHAAYYICMRCLVYTFTNMDWFWCLKLPWLLFLQLHM